MHKQGSACRPYMYGAGTPLSCTVAVGAKRGLDPDSWAQHFEREQKPGTIPSDDVRHRRVTVSVLESFPSFALGLAAFIPNRGHCQSQGLQLTGQRAEHCARSLLNRHHNPSHPDCPEYK
jgi:hypothetical protein